MKELGTTRTRRLKTISVVTIVTIFVTLLTAHLEYVVMVRRCERRNRDIAHYTGGFYCYLAFRAFEDVPNKKKLEADKAFFEKQMCRDARLFAQSVSDKPWRYGLGQVNLLVRTLLLLREKHEPGSSVDYDTETDHVISTAIARWLDAHPKERLGFWTAWEHDVGRFPSLLHDLKN